MGLAKTVNTELGLAYHEIVSVDEPKVGKCG